LASFYNYPAVAYPVVVKDLGVITVQGTIEQINENVRGWRRMPHYLAVADGLRITGTAPTLTGTYSLSIVGYIRAKNNEIYPSIASSALGAAGATAGATTPGGAFGGGAAPPAAGGPKGAGSGD
jgi:hypothetical protein